MALRRGSAHLLNHDLHIFGCRHKQPANET